MQVRELIRLDLDNIIILKLAFNLSVYCQILGEVLDFFIFMEMKTVEVAK